MMWNHFICYNCPVLNVYTKGFIFTITIHHNVRKTKLLLKYLCSCSNVDDSLYKNVFKKYFGLSMRFNNKCIVSV